MSDSIHVQIVCAICGKTRMVPPSQSYMKTCGKACGYKYRAKKPSVHGQANHNVTL